MFQKITPTIYFIKSTLEARYFLRMASKCKYITHLAIRTKVDHKWKWNLQKLYTPLILTQLRFKHSSSNLTKLVMLSKSVQAE